MSNNLVIVAIPAQDELVWKVSSEKIPHLTLCFLGDAESNNNVDQIMQFVQHAVTVSEHGPFYLDVDRRDTLGEDEADVLHFRKSWGFKWVKQFRDQLLQNGSIRKAYDSTEQFPEWQPHLTLGYPETPAKEIEDDRRLYSVEFDRIAVWTGNYEGPEFRLEYPERDFTEMGLGRALAYSDLTKNGEAAVVGLLPSKPDALGKEFIEHVGVKGMRWGVRNAVRKTAPFNKRARNAEIIISSVEKRKAGKPDRQAKKEAKQVAKTEKKLAKADSAWENRIYSVPGAIAVHNAAAEHFNARIGAINDKHDVTFTDAHWNDHTRKSWSPEQKAYMDEVDRVSTEGTRRAVAKVHGSSPSGKLFARVSDDGTRILVEKVKTEAKHAAEDQEEILTVLKITKNDKGLIIKLEPLMTDEPDEMAQSTDLTEEFIDGMLHVGVKGMRWGVRKERPLPQPTAPKATSTVPHGDKRKTKIKAEGGENHPAHQDAIKVAEARVKLHKSGPAALSNQELREVATRMQLEGQVKQLTRSGGSKFVGNLLRTQGEQEVNARINVNRQQRLRPQQKAA